MVALNSLSLADMTRVSADLRAITGDSVNEVADRAVRYLHEVLEGRSAATRACALVRIYKTVRYGNLSPDLQTVASAILGGPPSDDVRCFTLLATAGDEPAWNDIASSEGHRTIPLLSVDAVAQIPMLAALIQQLGFELSSVGAPSAGRASPSTEDRAQRAVHVRQGVLGGRPERLLCRRAASPFSRRPSALSTLVPSTRPPGERDGRADRNHEAGTGPRRREARLPAVPRHPVRGTAGR